MVCLTARAPRTRGPRVADSSRRGKLPVAKNFSRQVSDGMEVFDANDDKVGTVDEVYDASGAEKSSSGGGYLRRVVAPLFAATRKCVSQGGTL